MIAPIHKTGRKLRATVFATALLCGAVLQAAASVESDLPPRLAELQNTGHYKELASALQDAVKDQPQSAVLYYWLGRSYYELRDYDKAASNLERATELAPMRSEYHDWFGKALGRRAQQVNPFSAMSLARKALHAFRSAVRVAPTNVEAQRDLIRYLLNAPGFLGGGEDESLKQIQALSVVDAVDGMLARAEYFTTRKKFDQAGAEYQKILKMNVHRPGVDMEIADFYCDRGDAVHMQAAVDAAEQSGPDDPRLDYYRGVALVLAKENAPAEKYLRTYLEEVPDGSQVPSHSSAHQWLGKLYEAERMPDRALAEYQAASALDPRNDDVRKAAERLSKQNN
jgi:tetratricopeptide (TPR) repeat protein